jgi:hypothetical protein
MQDAIDVEKNAAYCLHVFPLILQDILQYITSLFAILRKSFYYSGLHIVAMFAISLATLKRYLKRQRKTGDVRAKPLPGRPAKKGAALQVGLLSQLDAYPDATLVERCQIYEKASEEVLVSRKSQGVV